MGRYLFLLFLLVGCGSNSLRFRGDSSDVQNVIPGPSPFPNAQFVPTPTPTPNSAPNSSPTPTPTPTPTPGTQPPLASGPNRTTAHGLGGNLVFETFIDGTKMYVGTNGGLSISTDGGNSFVNRTTNDGLGHNYVYSVWASGNDVYAGTYGGFSISRNGGTTFTNYTTANGLRNDWIGYVIGSGTTVYGATVNAGIAMTTNAGASFGSLEQGLGMHYIWGMSLIGTKIHLATSGGFAVSTNGGPFTLRPITGAVGVAADVFSTATQVLLGMTKGDGVWITRDDGVTYPTKIKPPNFGDMDAREVYNSGSTIYLGTASAGLFYTNDNGANWSSKTTADGLGSNDIRGILVVGTKLYLSTTNGLWISP